MSLTLTISDAQHSAEGVWKAHVAPGEIRRLGGAAASLGRLSVVLLDACAYDRARHELSFAPAAASILNVGSSDQAVFILDDEGRKQVAAAEQHPVPVENSIEPRKSPLGAGDAAFLKELSFLEASPRRAGELLLAEIRRVIPGDLRAYPRRRFYDTPDNFWGVEVQNRKQAIKVTVRGSERRFADMGLTVWLDRPPSYFAFKIHHEREVPAAVRIILAADRKNR